jgi:hypothetical protein
LALFVLWPATIASAASRIPNLANASALGAGDASPQSKPDPRKEYALLFGTVWTADKKPAYGIRVKIRRAQDKKARWELMSDHHGEFAQRVPPGAQDYVIWADVKVKKAKAKPETKVHVDKDERVDVSLHLTE